MMIREEKKKTRDTVMDVLIMMQMFQRRVYGPVNKDKYDVTQRLVGRGPNTRH